MSPGPRGRADAPRPAAAPAAVEARKVALTLDGHPVLRGASLSLAPGEVGLLTGPSGSGKSALLRLLLGLRPRASRVDLRAEALRVAGQDALRTPTRRLACHAGLLLQDPLVQLTQHDVASELAFRPENLGLAAREVDARVEAAARRFGLEGMLARPTAALSGGEAKRVALAAVLAAEPEVLLLDEPLGGLDDAWRQVLVGDLAREARGGAGRAVLVVEHRGTALEALRPRRWAMRDGRVEPETPARGPAAQRAAARNPAAARHGGQPADSARTRGARSRARREAPVVEARGLRVVRSGRAVLDGVDLALPSGVTLVLGPNGAGKTTLLRALAGLQAFEGRARVAGLDPAEEPPHRMARVVGYVPQRAEHMLAASSVDEELAFGPRHVRRAADAGTLARLAEEMGLAGLRGRHPLTLSGGEQQRLALACALAHGPRVLLLDEPTAGLDAGSLARALDVLATAGRDAAVLVATHDAELRPLADHAVALQAGRVAWAGPARAPASGAPRREVAA